MRLKILMFLSVALIPLLACGCVKEDERRRVDCVTEKPISDAVTESADSLKRVSGSESSTPEDAPPEEDGKEETVHEGFATFPYSRYFFI